jgi:hypothetical protein
VTGGICRGQFESLTKCSVVPRPRVFTSGARNLLENGRMKGDPLRRDLRLKFQDEPLPRNVLDVRLRAVRGGPLRWGNVEISI